MRVCDGKTEARVARRVKKTKKPRPSVKRCPPKKIINPKTGRCVNKTGAIGKKLAVPKKASAKTQREKEEQRRIQQRIQSDRWGSAIVGLAGMTEEEYKLVEERMAEEEEQRYIAAAIGD